MRIAIFGVGAVGAYFGGRLAQAGQEVIFIARGENLRALRSHGLKVESIDGDFAVFPVNATDDPAEVGPVDAIILGVKAWQVQEAAQALGPLIGPETFVVPLQNGVEAPAQLSEVLGPQHVFGGLCRIVSLVIDPGHIRHVGLMPYIAFGELDNRPSERGRRLLEAFSRAGVAAEIPENIQVAMWKKFLFIASISGVGAVTRAPIGVLRKIPETRQMLETVMKEVFEVARAHHIGLDEDAVASTMAFVDELPPGSTASMQRDIMDGRPSELSAQNGAVMRLGRQFGQATPVNGFIYTSLIPMELQARGQVSFQF